MLNLLFYFSAVNNEYFMILNSKKQYFLKMGSFYIYSYLLDLKFKSLMIIHVNNCRLEVEFSVLFTSSEGRVESCPVHWEMMSIEILPTFWSPLLLILHHNNSISKRLVNLYKCRLLMYMCAQIAHLFSRS